MKPNSEQLLDDLLADAMPAGFREALLDTTLRSARRRKTARKLNAVAGVACVGLFLTIYFWRTVPVSKDGRDAKDTEGTEIVMSQALTPNEVLRTEASSVETFTSSASTVAEIRTSEEAGRYQLINDQQLMALLPADSAVLIHHGPHEANLIFLKSPGE